MTPKRRRFAVLLGSLLLAASIISVPALAEEESGLVPYSQNGGDPIFFPTPAAPPTPTPEPTPSPTPEPTPPPTPTPTPEPTYSPTDEPDDNPDDNNNGNNSGNNNTNIDHTTPKPNGKVVTPAPTPHPSNRPTPTEQPSVNRTKITPKPQPAVTSTPEAASVDDGTNYVTFAQLNVKNNSLAVALFYGGLACAVLGGAGLIFLLIRYLKNRRRDERAAIFHEIEEAELRQRPARIPSSTPELMTSPSDRATRSPHPMEPSAQSRHAPPARQTATPQTHPSRPPFQHEEAPVPPHREPAYNEDLPPQRPRTGTGSPIIPVYASYYTEEFSLEEGQNTKASADAADNTAAASDAPAAVPSLASRLRAQRAARIVQNDHQDAASRPELRPTGKPLAESLNRSPSQPASPKAEQPAEPSAAPQAAEKLPEQPEQQSPAQSPAPKPDPIETAAGAHSKMPAEQEAEPPAEKTLPKPTALEDIPEQLTFQQPETAEQPDTAVEKTPGKDASPDDQLPGQISFL